MEQILELEDKDDITSISSRIDYVLPVLAGPEQYRPEKFRLLLVVPRKSKTLQSLVNMKLLARMMRTRAMEMAIVSDDPLVRDYAREAGVKAFNSLGNARWAGWVTRQAPVAAAIETLPPVAPVETAEAPPASSITNLPRSQRVIAGPKAKKKRYVVVKGSGRVGLLQQFGAFLLLFVLAAALIGGILTLLPQATVTLTPVAQPVQTQLVVRASTEIESVDFQTLTFPARMAQVELVMLGDIETVETELAPVGLAEGTVTFINRTEVEQIIPISTTLATSAGEPVEFLTTITATVPPGLDTTAPSIPVVALEPGPKGNVAAGKINRFLQSSYNVVVRVINEQSTGGGREEPTKIVVQDDKERLAAYLRQKVQQEGYRQLQASMGEQEFIPLQSLQVIVLDISYKEFAGDFSETFGGEMQAVIRGVVVGGYNANRLALAALEAQVPPGFELDPRGLHFGAGEVLEVDQTSVLFEILADGLATPLIDKHEVAQEIAWQPIGEAQRRLGEQYRLATVPGVELKPEWLVEWLGRLPFSSMRIDVVIKEPVALVAGGG